MWTAPRLHRAAALSCFLGSVLFLALPSSTETAVANGDTRTIRLYHARTGESIEATYRVDGHYDAAVLAKLNWFLRDWRRNEETNMDPRLIDAVWETYRAAGATQPIIVLCGYRSPETNAMLRHRSRAVAEHSQHILGKAMDTTMPGMSMEKIREIAMRLQRGGVGYYPSSNFVHIDVGGVRAWPRMSYDQLVRLFPDGKTVHIAADGRTLPGYEEARAEIESGGDSASVPPPPKAGNFLAWLFGGGGEDEHEDAASPPAPASESTTYMAEAESGQAADSETSPIAAAPAENKAQRPAAEEAKSTGEDSPPMPPRRPTDLADAADVSLPPVRKSLPRPDADAPERLADLPGIITQGPNGGKGALILGRADAPSQNEALAYAPMAQMEGLRFAAHERRAGPSGVAGNRAAIVSARRDVSDFRSMTGAIETADIETQTIFGPTLAGLRKAARIQSAALSNKLVSGYVAQFGMAATDLATNRFSGPAVAALESDTKQMADSSAVRKNGD